MKKFAPYGLYVEVFNITDFSFSEEFNAAIEAKQTAQQNALKAEQDLQRVKIEAEQEVEQAKAEAESYRLKNEQLTDKILLSDWIEKWDWPPAHRDRRGQQHDDAGFCPSCWNRLNRIRQRKAAPPPKNKPANKTATPIKMGAAVFSRLHAV